MYSADLDGYISFRLYDTLKWLGLVGCPLLAVILGIFGPSFGVTDPKHSLLVINIIGLSIGLILAFCQSLAYIDKEKEKNKKEENSSE